ncbi:amidohydrolase [Paracrocinitomix mangrovi]|uniref:amidohydrolase n=1 Tax=Paracrocinitomix mangrovi TaxID=2862509 RepID=UPI001C8E6585|nr:amidohydrolase [Paracrocinitomix mangrovi]UKN01527.1 amidohydrolase [Paracrocinitomix mangrovi]
MKPIYLFALIFIITSCYKSGEADMIIHNARIYSCDEDFNVYEAMAIKNGKIIQLGPEREILNGYKCDNIIDAANSPIYPGFHDAHCHFGGYAKTLNQVDLIGVVSFDEMIERITSFEETNDFEWITGRGWDHTIWEESEFPTNERLNELFPDKPAVFQRVDGHAGLANQKALELAGIDANTVIEGGEIVVKDGKCTGLVKDNALDLVTSKIPDYSEEFMLSLLQRAEEDLFEVGLTSINDAGVNAIERERFVKWYLNNNLKIKDYCMLFAEDENLEFAKENGIYSEGNLTIRSFKVLSDGSLGSRSACLIDPYSDDPHNHGFLLKSLDEFREIADLAVSLHYQVNTHCIGDSANRSILKVYEEMIGSENDHRWKIEHAQVLQEKDFDYFEMYNIIPSVQPTHCTSDMRWAEQRLGKERVKNAYAYQKLLDKAGLLALGTDFPVERISPLETFYAAVSRMDRNGFPEGGFQNENAISREDALRGITIWPAYSNFQEDLKGSLEEGKAADFVILTKDIMTIPFEEILSTYVEQTYLNGELVFESE